MANEAGSGTAVGPNAKFAISGKSSGLVPVIVIEAIGAFDVKPKNTRSGAGNVTTLEVKPSERVMLMVSVVTPLKSPGCTSNKSIPLL